MSTQSNWLATVLKQAIAYGSYNHVLNMSVKFTPEKVLSFLLYPASYGSQTSCKHFLCMESYVSYWTNVSCAV